MVSSVYSQYIFLYVPIIEALLKFATYVLKLHLESGCIGLKCVFLFCGFNVSKVEIQLQLQALKLIIEDAKKLYLEK